jgi:hypothetical protein
MINFLAVAKLFPNASLFTIYEVNWPSLNWQIGHGKWFTIANFLPYLHFLIAKFDCIIFSNHWQKILTIENTGKSDG